MSREVEYFEEEDGSIPGVAFEERLETANNRVERGLLNALRRWAQYAAAEGPTGEGGGHFEKCSGVSVWQIKASKGNRRGRWFFGWDEERGRLVLLSGIVKGPREATPPEAYSAAQAEWKRYKETHRIAEEDE